MRIRKIALLLLLAMLLTPLCGAAAAQGDGSGGNRWGFKHKDGVVLVLSGGGTKGLSHIGVIEVLERENIPIAAVVGTSMGSIIGGLYAAGYSTEEMHKILSDADLMDIISGRTDSIPAYNPGNNRPPASGTSLLTFFADEDMKLVGRRGILKGKELYTFISDLTSRVSETNFNLFPIPFAAVACDLANGDTVLLRGGNLASALRASMSIPILFEPWEVDGRLLVDGGLKANLPVIDAKKIFPDHPVVAVNLSPEDITRPRERLNTTFDVSAQTLEILMVEQVRANAAEADLVIAPDVSEFGVLDAEGYDKIIARGRDAAEKQIGPLRELAQVFKSGRQHPELGEPISPRKMTVAEIHFNGVPVSVAEELYEKFESWVGKPLDMARVAEEVRRLSAREEFLKVDSSTRNITEDTVALVFTIERPQKYEISFNGYASNLHPDRWFSATMTARDMLFDGDTASFEARFSENWGGMLRYFTPLDERDRQFGVTLAARKENYNPAGFGKIDFERYSGKLVYYRDYGRGMRFGAGYAASRTSFGDKDTESGPYISFTYNNLDDPVMPSSGFAASTELWYPLGERLISRTMLSTYLPLEGKQKIAISAGLKTGDGDNLPFAAMLGSQEELYSLSKKPLIGDQAWWVHIGTASTLMKTWWGGVSVEAFGKYGQVMRDWRNSGSWWEVGLGFSISTNVLPGKLIVVYDQGGEFTFGYTIGIPNFWSGPLP